MTWCTPANPGIRLAVQVSPNASKSEVSGVFDDALKIRLQAQPIDGKANAALIRFLADKLAVRVRDINITHGHTGKRKILEISASGLTVDSATAALLPSGPARNQIR